MAESKRNIMNRKDGFNTRVNLYIIKHLYYRMKSRPVYENWKRKAQSLY